VSTGLPLEARPDGLPVCSHGVWWDDPVQLRGHLIDHHDLWLSEHGARLVFVLMATSNVGVNG
jgi:hypothetical protein